MKSTAVNTVMHRVAEGAVEKDAEIMQQEVIVHRDSQL